MTFAFIEGFDQYADNDEIVYRSLWAPDTVQSGDTIVSLQPGRDDAVGGQQANRQCIRFAEGNFQGLLRGFNGPDPGNGWLHVGFAWRKLTSGTGVSSNSICVIGGGISASFCRMRLDNSGGGGAEEIVFYDQFASKLDTNFEPVADQWYFLEFIIEVTSGNGDLTFYVDGVQQAQVLGTDWDFTVPPTRLGFFNTSGNRDFEVDDVFLRILDADPGEALGERQVVTLVPNADGATNEWAAQNPEFADRFNRANETLTASADWDDSESDLVTWEVTSEQLTISNASDTDEGIALVNASSGLFGETQVVELEIVDEGAGGGNFDGVGVCARVSGSPIGGNDYVWWGITNGGDRANLHNGASITGSGVVSGLFVAGDILRLEVDADTAAANSIRGIRVRDGLPEIIVQTSNTNLAAGGRPGVAAAVQTNWTTEPIFDNFRAFSVGLAGAAVTDTFNRLSETLNDDAKWEDCTGAGSPTSSLEVVANTRLGYSLGNNARVSSRIAEATYNFGEAQVVEATVTEVGVGGGVSDGIGIGARMQDDYDQTNNGVVFEFSISGSRWILHTGNGADITDSSPVGSVQAGDVLRLEVDADTSVVDSCRAYVRRGGVTTLIHSRENASLEAGGQPGVTTRWNNTQSTQSELDDFAAFDPEAPGANWQAVAENDRDASFAFDTVGRDIYDVGPTPIPNVDIDAVQLTTVGRRAGIGSHADMKAVIRFSDSGDIAAVPFATAGFGPNDYRHTSTAPIEAPNQMGPVVEAFTDDFNRSNEDVSANANWEDVIGPTLSAWKIVSNEATLTTSGIIEHGVALPTSVRDFSESQAVECTVRSVGNGMGFVNDTTFGIATNMQNGSNKGIAYGWSRATVDGDRLRIRGIGSNSQAVTISPALVAGDQLRLEYFSDTEMAYGYLKRVGQTAWSLMLTLDANAESVVPDAGGQPGLYHNMADLSVTAFGSIDNFVAYDSPIPENWDNFVLNNAQFGIEI